MLNAKEFENVLLLTDREHEVFMLVEEGLPTRQIAERLTRSIKTVETHLGHIKQKLGIEHRDGLTRFAARYGVFRQESGTIRTPNPQPSARYQFEKAA